MATSPAMHWHRVHDPEIAIWRVKWRKWDLRYISHRTWDLYCISLYFI